MGQPGRGSRLCCRDRNELGVIGDFGCCDDFFCRSGEKFIFTVGIRRCVAGYGQHFFLYGVDEAIKSAILGPNQQPAIVDSQCSSIADEFSRPGCYAGVCVDYRNLIFSAGDDLLAGDD